METSSPTFGTGTTQEVLKLKGKQVSPFRKIGVCMFAVFVFGAGGRSVRAHADEISELKKTVADLQKRIDALEDGKKKEAESKAKALKPVDSGFGKIKIGGLAQNWLVSDDAAGAHESYRLRRMELNFKGEINDRVSWGVMVDPSKALTMNAVTVPEPIPPATTVTVTPGVNQRSNILQDAVIAYKLNDKLALDVGQEKLPLSLEGLQSSAKLDTVERALFITGARNASVAYGDVRSPGIQLKGKFMDGDFTIGLVNDSGELQNTTDNNDSKNITGRLAFRPRGSKGLQLGVSGLAGGGAGTTSLTRNRLGGELLYQNEGWTLKSEYMTGTDQAAAGGPEFDRVGWYVHLGKQLNPKWEVVARYDTWDPDEVEGGVPAHAGGVNPDEKDIILGFNYLLEAFHAKLQLNWVHKNFEKALAASPAPDRDQILVNVQTAW